MPVFRVQKNANYTTMSNYHLRDSTISFKAKGILSMFLSLPSDWNYSVRGIAAISKEGIDGVLSGLRELEAAGYLERHRLRNEHGRLGDSEYVIYETPKQLMKSSPDTANPALANGQDQADPNLVLPTLVQTDLVIPELTNSDQVIPEQDISNQSSSAQSSTAETNTEVIKKDIQSTDEQNKEEYTPPRHRYGVYHNVLLTDSEYQTLQNLFPNDHAARIDRLSEYMASHGKTYKNHLATIRSWARKDAPKTIAYSHALYTHDGNDSL